MWLSVLFNQTTKQPSWMINSLPLLMPLWFFKNLQTLELGVDFSSYGRKYSHNHYAIEMTCSRQMFQRIWYICLCIHTKNIDSCFVSLITWKIMLWVVYCYITSLSKNWIWTIIEYIQVDLPLLYNITLEEFIVM